MNTILPWKNHCESVLRELDSFVVDDPYGEMNEYLLNHLESCTSCSREFTSRLKLKARLKLAVNTTSVPINLRRSIANAIRDRGSTPSNMFPWNVWSSAAAAVLVACLAGWGIMQLWRLPQNSERASGRMSDLDVPQQQISAILGIGVGDHIHCVIESHFDREVMTAADMAQQMGPEYKGLIPLIEEKLPKSFVLSAGHRCQVKGREFVHMVLKQGDEAVSLIITEKRGLSFPSTVGQVSSDSNGVILYQDWIDSLETAGFETTKHFTFVVSKLQKGENFQVASKLAPPISQFLNNL